MNDSGNPLAPALFNWYAPDYQPVWADRVKRMAKLKADQGLVMATKMYYRENTADFINDWGCTVDPRNARTIRPIIMPFVLFPEQRRFINWCLERLAKKEGGCMVKSRDCGASWLAMSISVALGIFEDNITIGVGSAIKNKVDNSGDPDSLFYKARAFVNYLPREYLGRSWNLKAHSADMKLFFPDTDSSITGDCGDNIGRGGRKTIYWVDEFAVVERPKLVESNLIANTDCCIEMSTVAGIANTFAEHARGGVMPRFDFDYHDDPRKCNLGAPIDIEHDDGKGGRKVWHIGTRDLYPEFALKRAKADPTIWAAEYERDFLASAEGIIIPQVWVEACVGAAQKLGLDITGERRAAYDVADRGPDKNCMGQSYGIELQHIESWSGGPLTIGKSMLKVYGECERLRVRDFDYDGDGMGAGARSDAERIEGDRADANRIVIRAHMFRGSAAVADPENICPGTDRLNKDFFENYKAQCWWALRRRAYLTWNWVVNGIACDPSEILSISPTLPELVKTKSELSQPVWTWSKSGKMVIDKTPDDVASPNNADTVMMLFPYYRPAMTISDDILAIFGAGQDGMLDLDDSPEQHF